MVVGNIDVDFLVKEEEKRGWMISLGRPRLKVCNLIRPPLKLFSFFFHALIENLTLITLLGIL